MDAEKRPIFDYSKLRGRIVEKYGTLYAFGKDAGFAKTTLYERLNNKSPFSQEEIFKAANKLDIADNEISVYFFNEIVR